VRTDEGVKAIRTTTLPGGAKVPVLGQGTWRMGEDPERRRSEVAALRTGIELGMTLIDTAEMYADGGAERIVGEAVASRRDDVFIVTKFYPQNATRERMAKACERSLKRLGTDRIDLYLLHWRGETPLRETLAGFADLIGSERIRFGGVSNFDVDDSEELARLKGFEHVVANEILYNLVRRGAELELIPWWRKRHRPVIAYSPIEEGLLSHAEHPALARVAERHHATAAQIALAWVIREPGVIAIPKTSRVARVKENRAATDIRLTKRDLDDLDESFAAPTEPVPLETR
jgi:diketogulonate reductase-like aldo/keto reductase